TQACCDWSVTQPRSMCAHVLRRDAAVPQPGGRQTIAQRLIAGPPSERERVPSGTAEPFTRCDDGEFFRPFGTRVSAAPLPNDEHPFRGGVRRAAANPPACSGPNGRNGSRGPVQALRRWTRRYSSQRDEFHHAERMRTI